MPARFSISAAILALAARSFLCLAMLSLALPGKAGAEEMRVGIAAAVQETVTGGLAQGGTHRLTVGEDLFLNERVITTADSSAVVEFRDRSTLEIGPNATVILDKSVYNPVESVSEKSITVVAGAFRFVSGVAAQKSETDIHTPVGTLGIRGSALFGNVYPQGDFIGGVAQGDAFFDQNGHVTNIPEGQAIIVLYGGGPPLVTPPLPFARFFKQFGGKFGSGGNLQGFSLGQQSQNGKDDTTPSGQQGGSGGNGNPNPQNPGGESDLKIFFSSFKGTGGGNGGDAGFVEFLFRSTLDQHGKNGANGVGGVIGDLQGALTPAEIIKIAAGWAAGNPNLGPVVARWLIHQFPKQGQAIINALGGVVPKDELGEIIKIVNEGSGGSNTYSPGGNTPSIIPPVPQNDPT